MNFLQTNNENQRIIAEGKYLECIKRFPEDTAAKLFLATMKLVKLSDGTDRTDEAIALLKTFDKTDRWHFDATFNLASAYIVKGDEVEATRLLTRLSQERGVKPDKRAKVEYNWGVLEKKLCRLDTARAHFKRAGDLPQARQALKHLQKLYDSTREPVINLD